MSIADKLKKPSGENGKAVSKQKAALKPDPVAKKIFKDAGKVQPPVQQAAAVLAGQQKTYEPEPVEDLLARLGANNPRRLRGGTSTGAKPMLRRILGTPITVGDSYIFPKFTVEELCVATGKGDVNIRTCLADLRSPKYCGAEGPFFTILVKENGDAYYQYSAEKTAALKAGETLLPKQEAADGQH